MIRSILLSALLSGLCAGSAMAEQQSLMIMLGNRQIGTLTFEQNANSSRLVSTMDNTPLGVANGTFEAVTQSNGNSVSYQGISRGSRTRDISFVREADTVTAVAVEPASEMTEMTDATKVPAGVLSPNEFLAALISNGTCPSPMTVYDGRRVVQIGTKAMTQNGARVNCDLAYAVILGPGHLSPFRFKTIDFKVTYSARELARIAVSAGGFTVNLIRE